MVKSEWVLGQMSGTSVDGVDVALLHTDGGATVLPGVGRVFPYRNTERTAILNGTRFARKVATRDLANREQWPEPIRDAETAATEAHIRSLRAFLRSTGQRPAVIGYHGQTLLHRPAEQFTLQAGCADRLASELGLPVVFGLRRMDLEVGGEGAPLAPFFHHAIARASGLLSPTAFLNLGGIGNVSAVDPAIPEPDTPGAVSAFDTGPGCGLVDDWVEIHGRGKFDRGGVLAERGHASRKALEALLGHPFFGVPPPKSLDRGAFSLDAVQDLSVEDGAATLVSFTAEAVALAADWLEPAPELWLVCGGGRRNPALMSELRRVIQVPVRPIESVGWDGDLLEALAFAHLGMRAIQGRTISAPATTGCTKPAAGGQIAWPGRGTGEHLDSDQGQDR